jgi:CubicO group peptidase (beta-lactamase class C family)
MKALRLVDEWPVTTAAVGVVTTGGFEATTGPVDHALAWASVTKVLTALACWVAVEEGTLDLDAPAGPPGSTARHLLAHASGLAFDDDSVLARPGKLRIYSSRGIELVADVVARQAAMPFADYLRVGVLEPLGMRATALHGSPAADASGPLRDLLLLARELQAPRLVDATTLATATAVSFPGIAGVLPGFGRQTPNDWGLGVEVRGSKRPHWTADTCSPRTFGHFGQAGGFLWVDPDAGVACCCLTDRPFGRWAAEAWPALSAAVLAELAA